MELTKLLGLMMLVLVEEKVAKLVLAEEEAECSGGADIAN
ncbi:hypothetical protein PF010_g16163 [Phytophthora fragariae]|uniref:RxLR effector protein n=1 Tax=Phytophthora fragariae TaxID=53985 RepID=A0A6A3RB19_9STRA|nr:hypothetical protein PF003_g2768 [Phytophthora fragariae]KAE9092890.1 hypothetical protein PF007_g18312 [Phytophthora fragariae]KAE9096903.1 hypothetical protein PF010_g16163 [Phytophthora fragariae]KAE9120707.1 hypothetical protein PF006_g18067 [Phytophthora fragariae]KAE9294233.1 hypothetical protein PF001_g17877 [Phytophthora fragariae]